ncbi:MAG: DUF2058 family protein [Thermodesulfobacteriota bacterium]
MGNPFQDQFLKAGLVNKKQVKKAKHEKRVKRPNKDASKQKANEAMAAKKAQERQNQELNRKLQQQRQEEEKKAQARQLIADHGLEIEQPEEFYHFVEDNKIKRLQVSGNQVEGLSRGQLAIVKDDASYVLVEAKVAHKIKERQGELIIAWHQ